MNHKDEQLKIDIAKRVKTVFYMRTVVRPLLVEMCLFTACIVAVCLTVSVPSILMNLHLYKVAMYGTYIASAFVHTKVAVQALSLLSIVFLALLIKDIIKNFKHLRKLNFA